MVCRMDDPDTETYEGLNRVTEYDFDRLGRQIAITAYDPNDTTEHVAEQTTTYEYNKNAQVTKITYPDDSFVEYIYNSLRMVDEAIQRDGSSVCVIGLYFVQNCFHPESRA